MRFPGHGANFARLHSTGSARFAAATRSFAAKPAPFLVRMRREGSMTFLSDKAIERLRQNANLPDLSGTRYRVLERVARGGMGTVYSARDETLDRRVALKVLDVPVADGDLAHRLNREARVLALLEHP